MVKEDGKKCPTRIHYADIWGSREAKYETLFNTNINSTKWIELTPNSPFYFFIPREENQRTEYEKGWNIKDIFPINSTGIVTARDGIVIDFEKSALCKRISKFSDNKLSDEEVRSTYFGDKKSGKYPLGDSRGWKLGDARKQLQKEDNIENQIKYLLYRPFDIRPIYYTNYMVDWPRPEVMRHMVVGNNIGFCTNREVNNDFCHVLCSKILINDCTVSLQTKERTYLFPLLPLPR
jgi:predicted helicase